MYVTRTDTIKTWYITVTLSWLILLIMTKRGQHSVLHLYLPPSVLASRVTCTWLDALNISCLLLVQSVHPIELEQRCECLTLVLCVFFFFLIRTNTRHCWPVYKKPTVSSGVVLLFVCKDSESKSESYRWTSGGSDLQNISRQLHLVWGQVSASVPWRVLLVS